MSAIAAMLAQVPPEQREMLRGALELQAQELEMILEHYTELGAEQRRVLAEQAVGEQLQIATQIIPTLRGDAVEKYPTIGVQVWDPKGKKGMIKAPKRIGPATELGDAIHFAMVSALLTTPGPRTILRAYGFNYSFVQSPEKLGEDNKPKIIL